MRCEGWYKTAAAFDHVMHNLMRVGITFNAPIMRTTLSIDDDLFNQALELSEPGMDKADLVREAIRTYVRVQAAKRLAALGGQTPDMKLPSRRKPAAAVTKP